MEELVIVSKNFKSNLANTAHKLMLAIFSLSRELLG